MRIGINCRSFLNKNYTGIGRYAYNLVQSLSDIDIDNRYCLYAKKNVFSLHKRIPYIQGKNFFLKIDRWNRGLRQVLKDIDIYHSPSPDALDIDGVKIIVTVHDLIFKTFPQGHTQKTIEATEKQFQNIVKYADKIICVSKNTINDMSQYFNIDKKKISLVYQGVDKSIFYPMELEENLVAQKFIRSKGINEPFILSVGTIEPRKNLENLIYSFNILKSKKLFFGKLAIVGMKGWMSEGIATLVRKLDLKEDIVFLGYLTDNQLRYFYNNAQVFVFPSFYEGFGFPIIEAFCCGAPVVTSNVSSCPEIAQDAAVISDPYKPADIANGIVQILHDEKLRRTLREKGFVRSVDFSFRKMAQETFDVYEEVYKFGDR